MPNLFHLMAAGKSCDDVLLAAAATSPEELQQHAAGVSDEQLSWVLSFTEKIVGNTGVRKAIIDGAVLYAVSLIEDRPHRRELVDCLYEDLGLHRSEGYRSIQIWLAFGPTLIAEPKLQKRFCAGSLAVLAQMQTPPAAREEALQLAREGEKISINRAESLQAQHGVLPEPTPSKEESPSSAPARPSKPRRPKTPKWRFVGSAARIEVIPTGSPDLTDVDGVVRDLEAAIDQWRSGGPAEQAV